MFKSRRDPDERPTMFSAAETKLIKAVVDGESRGVHDPKATYELAQISQGRRAA